MKRGKDYIVFPLDVPVETEARKLVEQLHEHVGMFKIGLELFIRSGPDLVRWMGDHAAAAIFLDLKLHDIPATVKRAMQGIADLNIALTTVHCGESQAMLEAAVEGSGGRVGVLGVTVLTSVSGQDLAASGYPQEMADDVGRLVRHRAGMAKQSGCAGIVCSGHEAAMIKQSFGPDFLAVTPGIRPDWGDANRDDQRRIVTPAMAVAQGADFLVIGRPIRDADEPVAAAVRIAGEIDEELQAKQA